MIMGVPESDCNLVESTKYAMIACGNHDDKCLDYNLEVIDDKHLRVSLTFKIGNLGIIPNKNEKWILWYIYGVWFGGCGTGPRHVKRNIRFDPRILFGGYSYEETINWGGLLWSCGKPRTPEGYGRKLYSAGILSIPPRKAIPIAPYYARKCRVNIKFKKQHYLGHDHYEAWICIRDPEHKVVSNSLVLVEYNGGYHIVFPVWRRFRDKACFYVSGRDRNFLGTKNTIETADVYIHYRP